MDSEVADGVLGEALQLAETVVLCRWPCLSLPSHGPLVARARGQILSVPYRMAATGRYFGARLVWGSTRAVVVSCCSYAHVVVGKYRLHQAKVPPPPSSPCFSALCGTWDAWAWDMVRES